MTLRHRPSVALVAAAALASGASALGAHDFWIRPATFQPSTGVPVAVELRVGDDLVGVGVARRSARTVRFEVAGRFALAGGDAIQVAGREGAEPAGFVRLDEPGLHAVVYESRHSQIEIEPARFHEYLIDKGLETVVAAREAAGVSHLPGRERYARCAKALLAAVTAEGRDRPVGLTLELVAEDNPYLIAPDQPLRFRLLYRGEPLAGALVEARRAEGGAGVEARTGADGRVSMHLDGSGMWLVSAVHMVPETGRPDAEWESTWASLTFERRGSAE